MNRSAKELCAMLITRGINTLNEEEADVVVDYLEEVGVEVELDTTPKELCLNLLDKTMQEDLGRRVPLTAYANSLIEKEKKTSEEKLVKRKEREIGRKRRRFEEELERKSNQLPGCIPDENNLVSRDLYDLVVDENVGVIVLPDNSLQYAALISVPEDMYRRIFLNISNPVIEIISSKGYKAYDRIESAYQTQENRILLSPLV